MEFRNDYADARRAETYSRLDFPGTYELAFRELPEIMRRQAFGRRALDFGCGAGRSTRFLRGLGFRAAGIDISPDMLGQARALDPAGDYRLMDAEAGLPFEDGSFDLVFSAFTFDNIPSRERKIAVFRELGRVLAPTGRLVNLVSTPEIYLYEWVSFSTRNYPENRLAGCGDPVLIVNTATEDPRPVTDILWPDTAYREVYEESGLELLEARKLLARPDETAAWVTESRLAPWCVYVLRPQIR